MASIAKRPDGQYRAVRDAAGKEHARRFRRRTDAQRWLDEVTTAVITGQYVSGRGVIPGTAEDCRVGADHPIADSRDRCARGTSGRVSAAG